MEKLLSILNSNLDKVVHFLGGYLLATILPAPPLVGLIIAITVGILKEIRDWRSKKGTPEVLDAIATIAGGLLGYLVLLSK